MCLRGTARTVRDLRALADLIDRIGTESYTLYNTRPRPSDEELYQQSGEIADRATSSEAQELLARTVGSLLGVVVLHNAESFYGQFQQSGLQSYREVLDVDLDAWIHSVILAPADDRDA